jgi:3-oxoadipate CoA-transferase alpha subunit
MAINKVVASFDEAVADMQDGAVVMIGGFGTPASTPGFLVEAVARKRVNNLTTVSNIAGYGPDLWRLGGYKGMVEDMDILVRNNLVKKAIVSVPVTTVIQNTFERQVRAGEVEMEMVPQGTLAERVRAAKAGVGGFYTRVGVGTVVEEGKETKIIDGHKYLLEYPIKADFALIKARKADRWGNLVYEGTSRTFNATMAGAAKITIAEVDEVVELGELDPEVIVTPGLYVDRVVVRPQEVVPEKEEVSAEAKEAIERFKERGRA